MGNILLILVTVFLCFKLFSLLGQKREVKWKRGAPKPGCGGCAGAGASAPVQEDMKEVEVELSKVTDPLQRIKIFDPSFKLETFLENAKEAYNTILKAYAKGDMQCLSTLLNIEMMRKFAYEVAKREDAKQDCEIKVLKIKNSHMDKVFFDDDAIAKIRITFDAEVINCIMEKNKVLSGDKTKVEKRTDTWIFSRNLRTTDPVWKLVEVDQLFV